jgi:hypothetical protein
MLNIIQKKGVSNPLMGRVLVYARILPGNESPPGSFPWEDMTRNGLLVVSGDFKTQHNLADFLRKEFKGELGDGLEGLVQKLRELGEDIPDDLNPEEIRRRLDGMSNMEIIPVPAKVVTFDSEDAILEEVADIFFVGEFHGVQHAHLAVTSFPILYQSIYREQQALRTMTEINSLLDQALDSSEAKAITTPQRGDPVVLEIKGTLETFKGNLLEFLMGQVIPNLIYNLGYPAEFSLSIQNFKLFMKHYRWPLDVVEIEDSLYRLKGGDHRQNRHIELLCRKISALFHEEFERLPAIQSELAQFK